jgi:hypothetical protein
MFENVKIRAKSTVSFPQSLDISHEFGQKKEGKRNGTLHMNIY